MDTSLILVLADGRQSEIPLRRPVQVIGRQTDCQIRIPSGNISRHHCEVMLSDGKLSVRDLGSSNGTYVNRRRVSQADLQAGDLLAIGDMVFVAKIDGRPTHVDSEDVLEDGQVKPASAGATPAPKAAAKPAARKSVLEDSDGSSVGDFDFLDDEDIKKQPKL
ncbi:MAG: FHA domain-containing protein [Phycisphaerales bacterium]|nr:FHA domain-containing protein [Phycisphaerales bacterium]